MMAYLKINKFSSTVFITIFTILLFSFSPLSNPLERIIAGFKRYITELPQEKVYLHLDRPNYSAGETIWFKVYLTAGSYHEPSLFSNTIYVELINSSGEVIQQDQLFSREGFAAGQLELDESLPSGNYLVRSYTNWMRNADEAYFFHKQIKIWNTQDPINNALSDETIALQFFPEGGNLINGIMSKVGFKAIGMDGLGKVVSGKVYEGEKEVATFESNQFGMGVFALMPKEGKKYTATIENSQEIVTLPKALDSGIILSVTNSPTTADLLVKVQASENSTLQTVYLLAQTRGIVCASSQADLSKKVSFTRIPKKEFPSGIAQITVLDEAGNPLAERLVFIDHQDQMTITASMDKSVYKPRERVQIDIEAKDKEGNPVAANMSLSVVDGSQVALSENKETIQSNLLLSSELKGHIESPGYYFNPSNQDRAKDLDILMLTQGWRRFTIKEALSEKVTDPEYGVEKGLTIRGVLTDEKKNQPIESGTVSYLSLFPFPESKTAVTNSKGEFEIQDLIFFDSTKIILQGKTSNGRIATILTESSYSSPQLFYQLYSDFTQPSALDQNFLTNAAVRLAIDKAFDFDNSEFALEGVEVRAKRIDQPSNISSTYGAGTVQMQVAGKPALENLLNPIDLLRGRVAGVQITGYGESAKILIQGVNSINSSMEPMLMVDDIQVRLESLLTIPVQEIEGYRVWKGADTAIFGARGSNGVIGFYTRKDLGTDKKTIQQDAALTMKGYQVEKEFYSPKYPADISSLPKPDQRATLFWAPNIQTDSSGKASVSFYNSDAEHLINGEIEGISGGGKPGSTKFNYTIEK
ncbi:TonB-dependent receptor plug domain-containing protein [Algoriphagus winogradskyi]|uniref:TonB-dependent Receptor Plug Domain n=2 Tax=Algoriphagus winogradskyi TaxID=237017 RepID=A0ABY1PM58_9BACT|nr:TonB-dependent receptor plug domain-containing protein [Algoriphagus winogradskyi]SMP34868.1 TonB-dependent Receptor Plug Domain [Algoriphagus winogradskyi]